MGQVLTIPARRKISPKNGTVPPKRRTNAAVRTREHLTEAEVSKLMKAARENGRRYGHRDATMILVAFHHALRVSELIDLRWSDINFNISPVRLHVRRLKGSVNGEHVIDHAEELNALRKLRRGNPDAEFVFVTERGGPMSAAGFRKMLARLAAVAGMSDLKVHPHALRHSTGYAQVNKGMDIRKLQVFMGHKEISNTARYTVLNAGAFKGMWSK
jgi:site-specific recombinase XerD